MTGRQLHHLEVGTSWGSHIGTLLSPGRPRCALESSSRLARQVGVRTLCIKPGSQWANGNAEIINGNLKDELLDRQPSRRCWKLVFVSAVARGLQHGRASLQSGLPSAGIRDLRHGLAFRFAPAGPVAVRRLRSTHIDSALSIGERSVEDHHSCGSH